METEDKDVDARIYGVNYKQATQEVKKDRFGTVIEVGDKVEFLTPGRVIGSIWTIYKLTDKRVLCHKHDGLLKAYREYKNVRKYN